MEPAQALVCLEGKTLFGRVARAAFAAILLSMLAPSAAQGAGLPTNDVNALAVDPTNEQVVYAGTATGIYKTVDGWKTWARVDSGLPYVHVLALAIHPHNPCTIYAGIDSGLTNVELPGQIVVRNTSGILAVSTNCGGTWSVAANAPSGRATRSLAFATATPTALYASITVNAASAGVSVTQHRVARMLPGFTDFSFSFEDFNYVVATDPGGSCVAYLGALSGTVRRSSGCEPGAMTWSAVGAPLSSAGAPAPVTALAVDPMNPSALLAGTAVGRLFRKADDASPWSPVATTTGSFSAIVYTPGNPAAVYAAGGQSVYRSMDGGRTWSGLALLHQQLSALAVGAPPVQRVYVATFAYVAQVASYPSVVTLGAVDVTATSATLTGTVNPNGNFTGTGFDWGPTPSYGNHAVVLPPPGDGNSRLTVAATIAGLTCNTQYHFRVTAGSGTGNVAGSSASFTTLSTGCVFTDASLIAGSTPIRLVHITELRSRIGALRARYGLPPFGWSDTLLAPGGVVRARHVLDLREALSAVYAAGGRALPMYTDPGLGAGTVARSAHVTELRAAVTALE